MLKGEKLREAIKATGLSEEKLSEMLGINRSTLNRSINGGIAKMPIDRFLKLLVILETTPEELLGEEELELVRKSDELRGLFKVIGEVQQEMVKELADLSPEEAQYMRDVLKGLPKLRKQ